MSAPHSVHHDHGDHGHDGHGDIGYHAAVGFVLAAILTAIPFWLVMGKVMPTNLTVVVILGFAAVQMVVHMIYFLHLNAKVEGGWSLLSLVFTLTLLVIVLVGSVWVMYHLNTNMMPMDPQTMRNMP